MKVIIFIKEHLRPLFKSGLISREIFSLVVEKSSNKVLSHHLSRGHTCADFLLTEGPQVRKLIDDYVAAFSQKPKN